MPCAFGTVPESAGSSEADIVADRIEFRGASSSDPTVLTFEFFATNEGDKRGTRSFNYGTDEAGTVGNYTFDLKAGRTKSITKTFDFQTTGKHRVSFGTKFVKVNINDDGVSGIDDGDSQGQITNRTKLILGAGALASVGIATGAHKKLLGGN